MRNVKSKKKKKTSNATNWPKRIFVSRTKINSWGLSCASHALWIHKITAFGDLEKTGDGKRGCARRGGGEVTHKSNFNWLTPSTSISDKSRRENLVCLWPDTARHTGKIRERWMNGKRSVSALFFFCYSITDHDWGLKSNLPFNENIRLTNCLAQEKN